LYFQRYSGAACDPMEHFLLEIFKIVAQYILGPVAIAWVTAKLNNKPKSLEVSFPENDPLKL
jgi:hypothetical protein